MSCVAAAQHPLPLGPFECSSVSRPSAFSKAGLLHCCWTLHWPTPYSCNRPVQTGCSLGYNNPVSLCMQGHDPLHGDTPQLVCSGGHDQCHSWLAHALNSANTRVVNNPPVRGGEGTAFLPSGFLRPFPVPPSQKSSPVPRTTAAAAAAAAMGP